MNRLIEIQRLRDNRLVLALVLFMGTLPLILYIMGWSHMQGFDNEEAGLVIITISVSLITIVALLNIKTSVCLEQDGLSYQNRPIFGKLRSISLSHMESWKIADYKWKQGLGYQSKFGGNKTFVLHPGKALVIKLKDGREFCFGINRPGLIKTFIQRNWEQNQMKNG